MAKRGVTTKVVGMTFYDGYPDSVLFNHPDFPRYLPTLVREPKNLFDENAVAVYFEDLKVGHLSKQVASVVGPDMDKGNEWNVVAAFVLVHPDSPEIPGVEITIARNLRR